MYLNYWKFSFNKIVIKYKVNSDRNNNQKNV